MTSDAAIWLNTLIFAVLVATLGLFGVASTGESDGRRMAAGLFVQSVGLLFAAAGNYYHAVPLKLGAMVIGGLLVLQAVRRRVMLKPAANAGEGPVE